MSALGPCPYASPSPQVLLGPQTFSRISGRLQELARILPTAWWAQRPLLPRAHSQPATMARASVTQVPLDEGAGVAMGMGWDSGMNPVGCGLDHGPVVCTCTSACTYLGGHKVQFVNCMLSASSCIMLWQLLAAPVCLHPSRNNKLVASVRLEFLCVAAVDRRCTTALNCWECTTYHQ